MKVVLAKLPLPTMLSYRVGLINAILFVGALISRTLFFVFDLQAGYNANIIGRSFFFDMFKLALVGTFIGVPLTSCALYGAERKSPEQKLARAVLAFHCLLLPLAFFLVFPFPHYFLHGVNFD